MDPARREHRKDDTALTPKQVLREISYGYVPAKAVYAAAKLGVADHVGEKPTAVSELANKTGTNEQALYRLLRFLSGLGVFRETTGREFSHTPVSEYLRSDHEYSERGVVILRGEELYESFGDILHSIRTLETGFRKRFGNSLFGYLQANAEAFSRFQTGMRSLTVFESRAAMRAYDFSPFRKVVDVGGGSGSNLSELLAAYPNMSGVLVDLQGSIEMARSGAGGPLPRCEFVVGDFFKDVAAGGDLYILKNILHDWYDDKAAEILRNCRRAMRSDSKLIIIERVMGGPNQHSHASNQDLMMMVVVGGLERREDEFASLVEQAGLRLNQVIETDGDIHVLECLPV